MRRVFTIRWLVMLAAVSVASARADTWIRIDDFNAGVAVGTKVVDQGESADITFEGGRAVIRPNGGDGLTLLSLKDSWADRALGIRAFVWARNCNNELYSVQISGGMGVNRAFTQIRDANTQLKRDSQTPENLANVDLWIGHFNLNTSNYSIASSSTWRIDYANDEKLKLTLRYDTRVANASGNRQGTMRLIEKRRYEEIPSGSNFGYIFAVSEDVTGGCYFEIDDIEVQVK